MTLLTIFTAPKPFTHPHINVIQRNAIRSWMQLDDVEVIIIQLLAHQCPIDRYEFESNTQFSCQAVGHIDVESHQVAVTIEIGIGQPVRCIADP